MAIGKLQRVQLRELWKHEERGFSKWLEENVDYLSEELGLRLTVVQRERAAGSFQVDLVAEDEAGNLVIIENQLDSTNHDHLGKVLTYLTNLEAKTAIWVAADVRPEHISAITWLNEATPADISFYLVRLEAVHIGGSDPAPLFSVIVGPSAETKGIGRQKKDLAERHVTRLKFWEQLLSRAKAKRVMYHANRSPVKDYAISGGTGRAGVHLNYVIWLEDKTAVDFHIDVGDQKENKRIFDALYAKKAQIEERFGGPLVWERLNDRRSSRIRCTLQNGGINDPESKWPAIQDAMIDAMDRLAKAMKFYESLYLRS